MSADILCRNCELRIYRVGGWYWLHAVSKDRRCATFAEPDRDGAIRAQLDDIDAHDQQEAGA